VLVVQGIGVIAMRETSSPKPGALASLKPEIKMPRAVRRPMFVAIPALAAGWALAGFYGSVGPAVTRIVTGSTSHVMGGVTLTVLAASGALTVLFLRHISARPIMIYGVAALGVGVAITLLGISWTSPVLFFIGAVIAGSGFGGAFQGAVRTVMPLAQPHQRAGVLSVIYVVSYLAMGLPAVVGGYHIVHAGGLLTTAREYGIAVIVLAAVALLGMLRPSRSETANEIAVGDSAGAAVNAPNVVVASDAGRVGVAGSLVEREMAEAA
jgi:MFS family permease